MKRIFLSVILIVLTACSAVPPEGAIQTAIAQTQLAQPSITPLLTATLTQTVTPTTIPSPTNTLTITPTPTETLTPTVTPTSTLTPTPIPLGLFMPLSFWEGLLSTPENYVGKYVRAFTNKVEADSYTPAIYIGSYWLFSPSYGPRGPYVYLVPDIAADESVKQLGQLEYFWIYAIIKEPRNGLAQLSVVHIEAIPSDQMPRGDGIYRVGVDIPPGRWKSTEDAITVQDCYWARSDANGNIIQNFFGYGGSTVYVASTDYAVEFNHCGLMVYLGK